MSKEKLEEAIEILTLFKGGAWVLPETLNESIELVIEQAERVQDQQAEIDSLSMAHDAIYREMPKDKHTLIKNLIALNAELNFTEEALEGFDKAYEKEKEQNKRYREAYKYLKSAIEFDKYVCHEKCQDVVSVKELQEGLLLFEELESEK